MNGQTQPTPAKSAGTAQMNDAAQISWQATGDRATGPAVVLLHGGPGLPDYLEDVAAMIDDLVPVYRYDQRGTGRSPWHGRHTLDRHLHDLAQLLDQWGLSRALLIGHSYGATVASRFCLAHPQRVSGLLLMCGAFVGDWQPLYQAERDRRMTLEQRHRLRELQQTADRTQEQEEELLTLAWVTDHADPLRGWQWAARDARQRRPVNWQMNAELGREGHQDPLDDHLTVLRSCRPAHTEILAAEGDPRPPSALESAAVQLGVPLTRIADAGHAPWLEQPEEVRTHLRRFIRGATAPEPDVEGVR